MCYTGPPRVIEDTRCSWSCFVPPLYCGTLGHSLLSNILLARHTLVGFTRRTAESDTSISMVVNFIAFVRFFLLFCFSQCSCCCRQYLLACVERRFLYLCLLFVYALQQFDMFMLWISLKAHAGRHAATNCGLLILVSDILCVCFCL